MFTSHLRPNCPIRVTPYEQIESESQAAPQIVYLAKAKRIIASPKANVNPYPKLSILTARLPVRRSVMPTWDM